MALNQAYLFLIFNFNGVFIGLVFDFFRILRQGFKTSNTITYAEDIMFWVISGLSIIYSMVNFSNGALRFFMVIGLIIGFITYILTISKYIRKFSVSIIIFLKKTVKFIWGIILCPLKIIHKMIIAPVEKIAKIAYRKSKKILFSSQNEKKSNDLPQDNTKKSKKYKKSAKKRGIFW